MQRFGSPRRLRPPVLVCLLVMLLFIRPVSANAPAPADSLPLHVADSLPEGAVYADLFAQLSPEDEAYTALNADNAAARGWNEDTPVVRYAQDGFVSLTFHLRGALLTEAVPSEGGNPLYFSEWNTDHLEILQQRCPLLKAALLDKDGHILQISDAVDIAPDRNGYLSGLYYSASGNTLGINWYEGSFIKEKKAAEPFVRMGFSVLAEILLALAFRIPKIWKVLLVNLGTQMFLTAFMAMTPLSYVWLVILGEAVVYAAEFGLYRVLYRNLSWKRLLLFTVTANTVTLLAGLALNPVHWFLY